MFSLLRRLSSQQSSSSTSVAEVAPADIFISYAQADKARVEAIEQRLTEWNWDVWRDRKLVNGQRFESVILGQLKAARCALVLWSKAAVASPWVKREATLALDSEKLFHALIEPCEVPAAFRGIQYHRLDDFAGQPGHVAFTALLNQLANRIGAKRRHVGTLVAPLPDQDLSDDHIALVHSCWRSRKFDKKYGGEMYRIQLMVVGHPLALERVEAVIYYLDPSYPTPEGETEPRRVITDRATNFVLDELANGYSLVRADVKVRQGQRTALVPLSRLVNMSETGPRLAEQFIAKAGPGSDPDRA